ncbi:Metallo-dependent phosphatase-like protein [Lasiosphaeria hispida]|uniref:Metallo-dependent phosphatase-like protein n=1 Tax=Lasiosphaeria hispida TaxID=260671 RepID=A0AAJ0HHB4_9PEZI|nr:Metallo-dependent phosphatase-like protein [Lasiosphaeria hispida]
MQQGIKTTFLLLSDTHAKNGVAVPDLPVDVAIHCGDLTDGSKIREFETTLALLRSIEAPLKIVIAGNHDFTLDEPVYQEKADTARRLFSITPELMRREYGNPGDAHRLISQEPEGIHFLDEGTHYFRLSNGADLTVYTSSFTPSIEADWGFQYRRGDNHDFAIHSKVNVVITHGPPKGVLDMTNSRQRGGCEQLFAAVARARPLLHCFGHIHEGWGGKLVAWRGTEPSENPSHFTDIDNGASSVIETLATIEPRQSDSAEMKLEKECRLRSLTEEGYRRTSHCSQGESPARQGQTTLFVNAAIQSGDEDGRPQLPWVVDIELPRSTDAGLETSGASSRTAA